MTLGEKTQQLRKAAGLSQEQLAELLGVSRQAVSKWETDQSLPDIDKILLLSKTFSVSTDQLLGNDAQAAQTPRLHDAVRLNMRKRLFTAGWLTALIGAVLLILEFFALFLIQHQEYLKGAWFPDAMQYTQTAPMPTIFAITGIVIAAGAVLAALGLVFKIK